MIVTKGTRIRLTGDAWEYSYQNREVYALVTFADGAWAKVDEQNILVSGGMVRGFEFEIAEES